MPRGKSSSHSAPQVRVTELMKEIERLAADRDRFGEALEQIRDHEVAGFAAKVARDALQRKAPHEPT